MRELKEIQVTKKIPAAIICNKCGRMEKIADHGFEQDKFHHFNINFGYYSNFFEQIWEFDICEDCLVDFVKTFKHSPAIYED